ncbi:metallophosphoesterase [Pseudotabrizicola alkalilacus]|uniref:Serine/threonine protein phosphatase n=1 Tax=Pseudotabrizicola alkalilacus TaxID=2305252 RepID=A0A411Z041_9RHOB|nr:metallophosphoesterase [Pseudotabrizicola alkalilacus]RGP36424.1 serine/threonine protein phosphatase [Pseudotabrizicola alkalilacus]
MLIAHLSDLHISAGPPETAPVRRDAPDMARLIVADLLALPQRPDAVLITGDVADGGSEADYALVRRILAPLSMPVFVVPGNHDRRGPMRAAFGATIPYASPVTLQFEAWVSGVRIIGLDSLLPGRVEGALDSAQLDWLEDRLATGADPVFLMLHHPPFPTGNAHWDASALRAGGQRLRRIVQSCRAPVRLLCGHVHQAFHTEWAGCYAAVGGSPAFQYGFGFGETTEPPLIDGPYAWWMHHRRGEGGFAVHPRYLALPLRQDLPR